MDLSSGGSDEENGKYSRRASTFAFIVTLWIEEGFEGFDKFANNEAATRSYTGAGVGHEKYTHEERAIRISREGGKYYRDVIRKFRDFRNKNDELKSSDEFTQYNLEYLLDRFD
jgi:hypothetical protein